MSYCLQCSVDYLEFSRVHPHIQYRHLVLKNGTTAGQHDIWSDCGSGWYLVRCTPPSSPQCPHPYPQYRHLVARSSTTSGQIDIWSAFASGWPVYIWVNLVPAATVIPAPWVDSKVVAVKKFICYCLQFSIGPSLVLTSMSSLQYTVFSFQEYIFSSVKLSLFLQYLFKIFTPVCFTTYWTKWSGHGKMTDPPPGELLHTTDLLPGWGNYLVYLRCSAVWRRLCNLTDSLDCWAITVPSTKQIAEKEGVRFPVICRLVAEEFT